MSTMDGIEEVRVSCPYCGEAIEIDVDRSGGAQDYIEDCQVCCEPIHLIVTTDAEGATNVRALREDDG